MVPPQKYILLVDDEPAVRAVAKRILERIGYRVFEAQDGEKALSLYHVHQNEIALVLLDLIMPNLGGAETLAQLRGLNPDVKVILCSGCDDGQARSILEQGANGFLTKPYSVATLADVIKGALAD